MTLGNELSNLTFYPCVTVTGAIIVAGKVFETITQHCLKKHNVITKGITVLLWTGELRTICNATHNVHTRLKNFSSNNSL